MKTQILLALTHHRGPQSQTYLGHKQLRAFLFLFSPDPWIISSSKHQPARKRREVAGCLFPANSNGIPWPGHNSNSLPAGCVPFLWELSESHLHSAFGSYKPGRVGALRLPTVRSWGPISEPGSCRAPGISESRRFPSCRGRVLIQKQGAFKLDQAALLLENVLSPEGLTGRQEKKTQTWLPPLLINDLGKGLFCKLVGFSKTQEWARNIATCLCRAFIWNGLETEDQEDHDYWDTPCIPLHGKYTVWDWTFSKSWDSIKF